MHSGYTEHKVKLIALEPILDIFNHLPLGGVTEICAAYPIKLSWPTGPIGFHSQIDISMLMVICAML